MRSDLPKHPGIGIDKIWPKSWMGLVSRAAIIAMVMIAVPGVHWLIVFVVPLAILVAGALFLLHRR